VGAVTRSRLAGRLLVAAASAAIALASLGVPFVAAADVTFGTATASAGFGKTLSFSQPITVTSSTVNRTELLLLFPGALGPNLNEVPATTTLGAGDHVLKFAWDPDKDGHIVPNTVITATWRLTMADGVVVEGPALRYRYRDDRFDWQTRKGDVVTIHWYEGDATFGTRALAIAETGVANAEKLLGVTEKDPIDFFVYADRTSFYDALGPGTPENVGGEAHADIRTMFALITPGQVNEAWVKEVVPHELTHLVFNTAVDNPYHAPPRWLNEGLAVYLSRGYTSSDRSEVEGAGDAGTLAPLASLTGAFPNGDRFFLAYAEGVSAVDYMVKTYGKPDLVKLIRSYAQGLTDDEAFTAALGVDVATFDAGWRRALGAKPMASTGPRPAPAGPLPSGWTGPGPGTGTAAPAASNAASPASAAPAAIASPEPSGQVTIEVPMNTVPAGVIIVAAALAGLVLVVVVVLVVAARGRETPGPGTPGPGTPGPGTPGPGSSGPGAPG
jgi:hypothetical protein